MATEIALRTMPIGNHMTNAEEIMTVPYKGAKKMESDGGSNPMCLDLSLCQHQIKNQRNCYATKP